MKQFVAMNKITGGLAIVVRVQLFDNVNHEEPLENLNGLSVILRDNDSYEGYLVESTFQSDTTAWLFVQRAPVDDACEILGEL